MAPILSAKRVHDFLIVSFLVVLSAGAWGADAGVPDAGTTSSALLDRFIDCEDKLAKHQNDEVLWWWLGIVGTAFAIAWGSRATIERSASVRTAHLEAAMARRKSESELVLAILKSIADGKGIADATKVLTPQLRHLKATLQEMVRVLDDFEKNPSQK